MASDAATQGHEVGISVPTHKLENHRMFKTLYRSANWSYPVYGLQSNESVMAKWSSTESGFLYRQGIPGCQHGIKGFDWPLSIGFWRCRSNRTLSMEFFPICNPSKRTEGSSYETCNLGWPRLVFRVWGFASLFAHSGHSNDEKPSEPRGPECGQCYASDSFEVKHGWRSSGSQ